MSGSKYETMAKAVEKKLEELNKGASDLVKQKQLEQKLKRIDKETERKIKEKKATPVKTEQIKQEAETEYDNFIISLNRKVNNDINNAELQLENLEINYKRNKDELLKQLNNVKEDSQIYLEKETIKAKAHKKC